MDLRSIHGNKLLVVGVRLGGEIEAYNGKNPNKVAVGDEIQSINGVSGDCESLLHLLRTCVNLKITFRRPVHRVITLCEDQGKRGLTVKRKEDPDDLVIHAIRPDSALAAWMADHPDEVICPEDRIISANNCSSVTEMMATLRERGDLEFVVAHHDHNEA